MLEEIRAPLKRGLENAYHNFERRGIDLYRSAMTEQHTFLVRWFFRFFRPVTVENEQITQVREAAEDSTIVYVMRHRSLLDYLFFNYLFVRKRLPLAKYANEINMLPILPWGLGIRTMLAKVTFFMRHGWLPNPVDSGWLKDQVANGRPVLLFLQRRQTFFERLRRRSPTGGVAEELIKAQRDSERPVKLVPLVLFWDRKPEQARKSVLDIVFGVSEQPGPIRKVGSFIRNRRRAVAAIGDPLDLKEFLATRPEDEAMGVTAKRVRWACLHYIYRERRVVTGARHLPVSRQARQILNSTAVSAEIERTARKERKPREAIEKRAQKMVYKIAADVRWNWLLVGEQLLTWVWNNIYSGLDVDREGLRKIKKVMKDHPVVLIPLHKSHADYLILSYVFFHQSLNVPFVAAGENLSFWPMGKIFRRMGGFFIRRRFGGDALYTAVFERYVHQLIKGGHTIEFFIEGGRSRTGRVLRPRLGLLGMIIRAWQQGVSDDIYLVPINVTYDTVIEEQEFIKELEGEKKEKESAAGMLRIWKVFTKRYGRVAVEFADPISVREHLGVTPAKFGDLDEALRRRSIKSLGEDVARAINDSGVVTAASLIAASILAQGRRGCMADTLKRRAALLLDLLDGQGVRLSKRLRRQGEKALSKATVHFVRRGLMREGEEDGEMYFVVEEDKRIALDLYKNMTLHFFAPAAFLATALLSGDPADEDRHTSMEEARARYVFLRDALRLEFAVEHADFDADFEAACEWLIEKKLIQRKGDELLIEPLATETLEILRGLMDSLIEGYFVAAKGIANTTGVATEAGLLKAVMSAGKRLYRDGFVNHREALEKPLLANGIKHLIRAGALERTSGSDDSGRGLELAEETRQEIVNALSQYLKV